MAEIGGAGGATVTYKFRPNPNTPKAIALSPKIEAALKVLVSRISERAKEIAPVITGEFRDSIGDDVIVDKGRWVGVVFAEAPYAAYVEFGTFNHEPHFTLREAAQTGVGWTF